MDLQETQDGNQALQDSTTKWDALAQQAFAKLANEMPHCELRLQKAIRFVSI
jgi:hypothetical protein